MKRSGIILLALLFCAVLLAGCEQAETNDDRPVVVATLFPQYDFAKNIAGEYADVRLLLDFGADAHTYDPTPADILTILSADLFLYTGGEMERWTEKLLSGSDVAAAIESGKLTVVDLSASVELLPSGDHDADEYDPHIWTSPKNAIAMCGAIEQALCAVDAAHAGAYAKAADAYRARLAALDEAALQLAADARLDECYFGGSFAFAYLFDECGIHAHSVFAGCAAHAEAAAGDISAIVREMQAENAAVVLYDSPSEEKIANTIAAETGAKVLRLHAIHNITKAEYEAGADYCSLTAQNLEVLKEALN